MSIDGVRRIESSICAADGLEREGSSAAAIQQLEFPPQ
jgi:hypothetical protein